MARTVATSAENSTAWEEGFRSSWRQLLEETVQAVRNHDHERLRGIRSDLAGLADELSGDSLARSAWQEYGGLLVNLRNVVAALIEVTESSELSSISARRSKRFPVSDKIPRIGRNEVSGRGGTRLGHRAEGYPERDERPTT